MTTTNPVIEITNDYVNTSWNDNKTDLFLGIDFASLGIPKNTVIAHKGLAIGHVTSWNIRREATPMYRLGDNERYANSYGRQEIEAQVSCNQEFLKQALANQGIISLYQQETPKENMETTSGCTPKLSSVKATTQLEKSRTVSQVQEILNQLTTKLVELFGNQLPIHNSFVGGGALRDLAQGIEPKDFDIFFFSEADIKIVNEFFTKIEQDLSYFHSTYSVSKSSLSNWNVDISFSDQVRRFQFITLVCGEPSELIRTFDYTINSNYYNIATEEIVIDPAAWSKTLVPCPKCIRPLNALMRLTKFLPRQYTINHKDMVTLVELATGRKFNEAEMQEQLCHLISG